MRTPAIERIKRRLDPNRSDNECWIWPGSRTGAGYGNVNLGPGLGYGLVHRVMYEDRFGPIPDGLVLDHVKARGCTSTACCNPVHLEAVTQGENCLRGEAPAIQLHHAGVCQNGHDAAEHSARRKDNTGRVSHCRACRRDRDRAKRKRYQSIGLSSSGTLYIRIPASSREPSAQR